MLFGCGGVDPKVYDGRAPKFVMKEVFNHDLEGYGFFQGRGKEVGTRYYASMHPEWNGNNLTLVQHFYGDDGKIIDTTWHLTVVDENLVTFTGDDVKGEGSGQTRGFAFAMKYTYITPTESKTTVKANDTFYLQPDGSLIDHAFMSKFGFHVGELVFHMHKLPKGAKFKTSYADAIEQGKGK